MIGYYFFSPIMTSKNIIIKYAITPFNLVEKNLELWKNIKKYFIFSYIFSTKIYSFFLIQIISVKADEIKQKKYSKNNQNNKKISKKYEKNSTKMKKINSEKNQKKMKKINNKKLKKNEKKFNFFDVDIEKNIDQNSTENLEVNLGNAVKNGNPIFISEKGLYQNVLITGTIGTGKTSSAMYPITMQLLKYSANEFDSKLGFLILDVKGNYYKQVMDFAEKYGRKKDIVVIQVGGKYKYNPLHKPDIKASVLANRLKIILELFSGKSSESYWIDKSEQILTECIKFCRIYNDGYVNFEELHNLVTNKEYYQEKIKIIKAKLIKRQLTKDECYSAFTAIKFFENEYFKMDSRTLSILKSQITRITNTFISDYEVKETFNSQKNKLNFKGLSQIIEEGKIVILSMNIAEYKNLSKIIAAYLKLDFQSEVMSRLSNPKKNKERPVVFLSDEYQEYITKTDADFYAQSREAKCINIVATQSYTSLLNTIGDENALRVIVQNLINKIWFRTDDMFTIEEAKKQLGKEEKEKITKSISESAKETKYSYITKDFKAKDANLSESYSSSIEKEYLFETEFFTQELKTFHAIVFISDGQKILKPEHVEMLPYFKI